MNCTALSYTDGYKLSHRGFMDEKTEYIYSNFTARSSKHFPVPKPYFDGKATFFGLQFFIKDFLINEWNKSFFLRPRDEVLAKFKRRTDAYLGEGSVSMAHFAELHDLGYLPISIKSLPEGASVPMKVPFFTIVNTDSRFAWLTNYLETVLSSEVWKPCYTATLVRSYRRVCEKYAAMTVGNNAHISFQLHGFECRGMSGRHDAAISGAGLLLSSFGTDTICAIDLLEEYYNANVEKEFVGVSIPASEHMVSSLGASLTSELEFFRKAITVNYPTGLVSLVSDTYDFFRVITEFIPLLKDDILNRKVNELGLSKVVLRPDSGNPVKIICGDPEAPEGSPERKGAVECLWEIFGGTITDKGYKVLHDRIGLIYGDGANYRMISGMLEGLEANGFASNNIVFGVGSYSMTLCSRDSLGMAQKATWAQVDGIGYDIFKDPVTDRDGLKKSAKGLLRIDIKDGEYVLKDQCTREEECGGELKEVFRNGKLLIETSLSEIRQRVISGIAANI